MSKNPQAIEDLLVTNRDFLPIALKLIENARKSIDLLAYSFSIGSPGGRYNEKSAAYAVARALVTAKRNRGDDLEIRIYMEGSRETAARNQVTARYLKKAGIEVVMGTTHAKGFCIDGSYVLFGSTNLTDQSIRRNNEANLVTNRPQIIRGFEKYFDHYWKGGKHGGIRLPPPLLADGAFKPSLLKLIERAKSSLEFSIYFFDLDAVEEALIQAHRRGVVVTGFLHDHRSFALSYVQRTRATMKRLRRTGITELSLGPDDLFSHSKFIVADRKKFMLGTGNWLPEDVDTHPQLYIAMSQPKLADELAQFMRVCQG